MPSFAHLHLHTEYSMLDGMSRTRDVAAYTRELGMDAVAITDHGAMYGVIEFYRNCKAQNVKPIIGLEAYMARRGREDRDPQQDRKYYHLLLLAQNQAGYLNLLKLASIAQLEGYYYKPRIDKETLAAHSEGLICTTGCLAAEIPQLLMEGREAEAKKTVSWYTDVFGDRFFVELQEHDIPQLHQVNRRLYELAPWANLPYVATNDVHYVRRDDAKPHDVLLCIGTSATINDPARLRFSGPTFYMRSPQEMWDIFGEIPESLENTVRIAEMCNVNLDDKEYKLPEFPVPEGYTAESYLRHLCEKGLTWRYGDRAADPAIRERLDYELGIIHEMGFDAYFLIVWDLCEFAEGHDIWWNVRGSGAGSVVAYTLRITSIDPLENNLLFERFLNPGRISMPDIDIDYPDDRRAEMIQYCVDRYGEDKVAQIITFGTLGARAAIRDVGRALDVSLQEVDALARMIPAIPGKPVTIQEALADIPDFQAAYQDRGRPYVKDLIDYARQLEGLTRHASTHAAGVLVADKPLVEYTPLNRATSENGEGLQSVSQWPMEIVESIGLLKVDFLGLRTLTIMRKACELIERYHGQRYNLNTIPYRHIKNPQTQAEHEHNARLDRAFELLWHGETSGVFQVEGEGMTRTLVNMRPSRFEHIIAAISLFRPGPLEYIPAYIRRMHGEEPIAYHHALLEPILDETYGIIVYQEQIMQIASSLFGYNLGDADLMRRAVAKKKEKDLMKHRAIFQGRGPERGIDDETAGRIFDDIEFFARYGFNKSHAADYAVLTVQTAYLKAHYPHEYMTALLTIEHGDTARVARYIGDCRHLGIDVLPPTINTSEPDFIIEEIPGGGRAIRYGLSAIKNVGGGSIEAILQARAEKPFSSADDFCERIDLRVVGKRALESLIKVGALDELADRLRLLESVDRMIGLSANQHRAADVGQMSLFGESTGVQLSRSSESVLVREVTINVKPRELLQWERELMGLYVSEHPLTGVMEQIGDAPTLTFSNDLTPEHNGRIVMMVGLVTYVRPHITRNGKSMAFAGLEDLGGTVELVIWPRTWEESKDEWAADRILVVKGKVDAERGDPKILVEEISPNLQFVRDADGAPPMLDSAILDDLQITDPLGRYDEQIPYFPDEDEFIPPSYREDTGVNTVVAAANSGYNEANSNGSPAPVILEPQDADEDFSIAENQVSDSAPPELLFSSVPPLPGRSKAAGTRAHVRLRFSRSADAEADRRRLGRVHGLLLQHPGNDTFSIVLEGEGREVELTFDEKVNREKAVPALIQKRMLSPEQIEVNEIKA